jgi:hypothetical protein
VKVVEMSQIFLSYAREDLQNAREIYRLLTENRLSVWMDKMELLPGQDWKLEIGKAIRSCNVFIACLSNKSVSKQGSVQWELQMAYEVLGTIPEGQIYIIPVRLDDCEVPSKLKGIHWLDFFEPGSRDILVKAIVSHTGTRQGLQNIQSDRQSSHMFSDVPLPKQKKTFTQFDKDRFLRESFDYIKQYFQHAVSKLQEHDPEIQVDFNDISSIEFTSKIYRRGNLVCQCQMWLGGMFSTNGIGYSEDARSVGQRNSYNDYLTVEEKEGELGLRTGMGIMQVDNRFATKEKAAEYLWKRHTSRLELG